MPNVKGKRPLRPLRHYWCRGVYCFQILLPQCEKVLQVGLKSGQRDDEAFEPNFRRQLPAMMPEITRMLESQIRPLGANVVVADGVAESQN